MADSEMGDHFRSLHFVFFQFLKFLQRLLLTKSTWDELILDQGTHFISQVVILVSHKENIV